MPPPPITPIDAWGPFAAALEPGERRARLRCLRACVRLLCGPRGRGAENALRAAEAVSAPDPDALTALLRLEPCDRRRVLASYAAISASR